MSPDPHDLLDPTFVDYCPIDCEVVCRSPRLCDDARKKAEAAQMPTIVLVHRDGTTR
jgi:hypothetical protein